MLSPVVAGYTFTFFASIVILFQFALALGMPWGHLAMGGKYTGQYPKHMRIACIPQIILWCVLITVVLAKAGILTVAASTALSIGMYAIFALMALGLFLNLITPSKWERILWAPVSLILSICSGILAFY